MTYSKRQDASVAVRTRTEETAVGTGHLEVSVIEHRLVSDNKLYMNSPERRWCIADDYGIGPRGGSRIAAGPPAFAMSCA